MVVIFPLALALALLVLWFSRGITGGQGRGCRWFWAWAVVGAGLTFSFLTGFSIGLFVLPFALAGLWLVLRASPRGRESIGFVEGIGIVLLVIAFLNRDYQPCPANGVLRLPANAPAGTSISCGGFDPHPWLYGGLVLAGLAATAYALVRACGDTR